MAEVFALGSINQDFVLRVERRPNPGETVTNAEPSTHNGDKGANAATAIAAVASILANSPATFTSRACSLGPRRSRSSLEAPSTRGLERPLRGYPAQPSFDVADGVA